MLDMLIMQHSMPSASTRVANPAADVAGYPVDLSLYMTNVFDKQYRQIGAVSGAGLGFDSALFGAPSQYGVTLRYRFGG